MTAAAGQRMDTCERYAPWGERGAGHPEGLGRVGCRTKHVRTSRKHVKGIGFSTVVSMSTLSLNAWRRAQ